MSEDVEIYGELKSERLAADNQVTRKIVKEINIFGINDRQRWLIIHQLALELENVNEMKELVSFINERKGKDIFITKIYGIDSESEEVE
jgi:hypothetical protein